MKDELIPKEFLQCNYCHKKFKYVSEKKRHELSHCSEFECKVCLKKFSFLSALKRHEKQHERKGTVHCKDCGGNFKDETLLKRHVKYAHYGAFTCVQCLSTFSSEAALNTHLKIHEPVEKRKYRCSFENCLKSFNFPHHLKHHKLTHTNSKQHYCSVCGKGFIQSHHLKRHLKSHEPESWLPCTVPECTKLFTTEYSRKRHYGTHKTEIGEGKLDLNKIPKGAGIITEKDCLICAKCGVLIAKKKMHAHSLECMITEKLSLPCDSPVNLSIQNNFNFEAKSHDDARNHFDEPVDNTAYNCKAAIGGCIVSEGGDESCLCTQILPATEEADDELNVLSQVVVKSKISIISDKQNFTASNKYSINACERCDCSRPETKNDDICVRLENFSVIEEKVPEIEYRTDGVIKLKDTLDIDTAIYGSNFFSRRNNESAPWSCKAILGNCIVSGNDTIGEGCLCAKMSQSISQASAQEIDEITICKM